MPTPDELRSVVDEYIDLVANGTAEQITELYAEGATVEDPVGTDPHVGLEGVRNFYKVIEPFKRTTELRWVKAAGNVAVFEFHIVTHFDAMTIELSPVDIMEFDEHGKVARMRALWGPEDMIRKDVAP